jgi:tetratricopeptide (TPR) repeat protein
MPNRPDLPKPPDDATDQPDAGALAATRIELLRELARESPEDATTQFLLGRELLAHARAAEAAQAFEAAIRANRDYAAAYRQLGNALEACDRHAEAAGAYREGIEVAARTHDLQAGKEMQAFLRRLARDHGTADP